MFDPTIPYATDEDIALRASADYSLLCPQDQKVACGSDGTIAAGSPWTLLSATVDFQAVGVAPGQVVEVESPPRPREQFVVVGVAPGAVTLRRKGQPPGTGMPPTSPTPGAGLNFKILSFGPQVALAGAELDRRFGIAVGGSPGRCEGGLAAPSELRDAVVYTVLHRCALDASRVTTSSGDNFAAKAAAFKAELDDILARLALHWDRSAGDDLAPMTTRFSTRMSR